MHVNMQYILLYENNILSSRNSQIWYKRTRWKWTLYKPFYFSVLFYFLCFYWQIPVTCARLLFCDHSKLSSSVVQGYIYTFWQFLSLTFLSSLSCPADVLTNDAVTCHGDLTIVTTGLAKFFFWFWIWNIFFYFNFIIVFVRFFKKGI